MFVDSNISFQGKYSFRSSVRKVPKMITRHYTAHNGVNPIYQPSEPSLLKKIGKWFKGIINATKG